MPDPGALPAATHFSSLTLRVRDLSRQIAFYRDLLGLDVLEGDDDSVTLGIDSGIISLKADPQATKPARITTGLYHLAILLPDRRALAQAITRLAESRYQIQGASDHGVSEAFYLADPEGNGIELYRDRPRSEWPYVNDQLIMTSKPVDQEGIFATLTPGEPLPERAPSGTRIGHLHLQVADLVQAQGFYHQILGFDLLMSLPSALFMSAGGYHHHLGFNTWQTAGAPLPAPRQQGLTGFTICVPTEGEASLKERLEQNSIGYQEAPEGITFPDPWSNQLTVEFRNRTASRV